MSRAFSLAGFEVTLIGRFWVTTEATIAEFMHVGPYPRRLDGVIGTPHSSAPFRTCSEAFDTAWPSQSPEQAVPLMTVFLLCENPT